MSLRDEEKKRIDILVGEYQACHSNRNHYDSVRWTIGAIFIAASLTLFGISFVEEVRSNFIHVNLIGFFSLAWMLVWYVLFVHVNPYIMVSIIRCHKIELELYEMGFNVRLHRSVAKTQERASSVIYRRFWGKDIAYHIFAIILYSWTIRVILSWMDNVQVVGTYGAIPFIIFLVLGIMILVLNKEVFRIDDWRKEIATITKERDVLEKSIGDRS